ncbi:3-phosphoshikimate 1-carboxyvinyltransferase [Actinomyces sp. B33]|uniref:3-phosphoshikimate 1-carboxyvinyltransferase n=1 Tax=Actinomyces sp. B33 TaxID=2942131 RepID=UPI0023406E0B|nr:3-phosphoshikimate 1-carboxyvinyltransferase [Actinomyces sp. B33]MDC4232690.1 3-phosphoshikimate 1-carboxyvinyltransferase [Actinomyces sp. B33]
MRGLWEAPVGAPLDAVVDVPGSKSQTARALYLAAVADSPSVIRGALRARDTDLLRDALRSLGADVRDDGDELRVRPMPLPAQAASIDCGLAGTVMRFLPPLAALGPEPVRFDGDEGARVRPLASLLDVLESLGASIDFEGEPGFLPLTIRGPLAAPPGPVVVDASASSQFLSSLLLVAPLLGREVEIRAAGPLVSAPHVEMTVEALRARGVGIDPVPGARSSAWRVRPGRPAGGSWDIEPDLSNAGPFLAATVVCGGTVTIPRWPGRTTQAGDAWRDLLPRLGARLDLTGRGLVVRGPGAGSYPGLDVDLSDAGELAPTLAAVLALASSPSRLTGIAHLRGHETDRLAALVAELRRLGAGAEELDDGLVIRPAPMRGTAVRTYADHRMATFAAIIGLVVPGVLVEDIGTTAKTLPGFARMWGAMLGRGDDR